MKNPTYNEICEYLRTEKGCYRCGGKWTTPCKNCKFTHEHWKKCFEEAKQILKNS